MKHKFSLLLGLMAVAGFLFLARPVNAADYTVDLTTFTPTASAASFTQGSFPNVSGGVNVRHLIVSNDSATAQTITVYDVCTSSTAATVAAKFDLPATIGTYQFPPYGEFLPREFKLTNPCVIRSSTTGTVTLDLFYE